MHRLTFATAAIIAFATAAQPANAETRGVAAAFGNTVKALYPDGKHQWLWFKADGTWEAFGRRGKWSSGKWSEKDAGKVCLKQARPIPIPFSYCTDFPANGGVGAVWTSKSMEGDPIKVTVVRGIQRPATAAAAGP
ncbi:MULTISPECIES: hypothetical protein [unclassified Phenylobacterium]|uniref:hypothetical protein n=1 Tax=unclassified Phenylobacterium TaxID=2640670 RepID=UPI00083A59E7|nr:MULTISPECIES: hypothetical protein [unclassified Phenylobacterium]